MTPLASRRADPEEIARLAPLDASSVLDPSAEPGFDDMLRLAAQVCGTPLALISLLDRDPQWFKARAGLDLRPTALAQSFCTQALGQTELLVIADLTKDPRTRHDPLVTGAPHLRFYAGTRLETPEGVGLGTLCVADGVARSAGLDPDQRAGLEALGRQVMRELALRRAPVWRALGVGDTVRDAGARRGDIIGALGPQSSQPDTVSDHDGLAGAAGIRGFGQIGTFDIDVATGLVRGSDPFWRLFGLEPRSGGAPAALFDARVHPDDRGVVAEAAQRLGGASAATVDYRILRADTGELRWVSRTAGPMAEAAGSRLRLIGTLQDITDRKAAEAATAAAQRRQRLATEAAGIGLWDYDPVSGVVRRDDLCCAMFGLPSGGTLTVERHLSAIHPEDRAAAAAALEQALDPAGSGEFHIAYRVGDGRSGSDRWIAASGHVTVAADQAGQVMGVAQDITRQKHNETRQAALIELGDALRDLDRTRDIAWTAARIMGRALGVDRVGYGTVDAVQQTIEILQDWTVPGMASVAGSHRFVAAGTLLEELDLGRPVAVDDAAGLPPRAADADTFAGLGARAMLNVPILEHGRLVAIVFLHHRGPRPWNEEEIGFVRNAADRVRAAVARVRAEEEQRLVNRELGHRLKNTLAMVQAIASQTLRNAPTLELAREALSARLVALGRAHDILLSGGDDRAPLRTLITGSLALTGDEAERFTLSGPDLVIGPKAALSVSLMIHELATNAVKYGALSRPEGRVDILWSVDARSGPEMFHMGWSEHGGPPVTVPDRRGFGSRLIERGLAGAVGGAMALRYEPAGVRCTLDAPLGAMMAEG